MLVKVGKWYFWRGTGTKRHNLPFRGLTFVRQRTRSLRIADIPHQAALSQSRGAPGKRRLYGRSVPCTQSGREIHSTHRLT